MRLARIEQFSFVLIAFMVLAACEGEKEILECPGGLLLYKNACMSSATIEFVSCTENRGFSFYDEASIEGGGTFRFVANASIEIARSTSQQENTEVALQIVQSCLELARESDQASQAERTAAAGFELEVEEARRAFDQQRLKETPSLTLSTESARKGEEVIVTGAQFQPNEMVDIRVHATLVKQVQADANGAFSTTIIVPPDAPPPNFGTSISATGQTSARSANAPFRTAP